MKSKKLEKKVDYTATERMFLLKEPSKKWKLFWKRHKAKLAASSLVDILKFQQLYNETERPKEK